MPCKIKLIHLFHFFLTLHGLYGRKLSCSAWSICTAVPFERLLLIFFFFLTWIILKNLKVKFFSPPKCAFRLGCWIVITIRNSLETTALVCRIAAGENVWQMRFCNIFVCDVQKACQQGRRKGRIKSSIQTVTVRWTGVGHGTRKWNCRYWIHPRGFLRA